MIGFCISGGIGDSILLSPVIRKLRDIFGDIEVFVFDKNVVPIIESIGIKCNFIGHFIYPSADIMIFEVHKKMHSSGIKLSIWNCFRTDHDGYCNFFISLDKTLNQLVEEKRQLYYNSLSRDMGKEIYPARRDGFNFHIAKFLCEEKDYYADWKRYGINVSLEDVVLKSPDRINNKLDHLSPYGIIHDSKLNFDKVNLSIKAWFPDRWEEISSYLSKKMNIIHLKTPRQKLFKDCVSSDEILPENKDFWDYLELLRRSSVYVGTDSWPGHAAITLKDHKFLILKGAVSYRWDHFGKYSRVVRKGKCQCCEYLSLEKCIFGNGEKCCMKQIKVNDVKEELDLLLK